MRTIRTSGGGSFGLGSDNLALGGVGRRVRKKQGGEDGIGSLSPEQAGEPQPFDDAPMEEKPAVAVAAPAKMASANPGGVAGGKNGGVIPGDIVDGGAVCGETDPPAKSTESSARRLRLNLPPVEMVESQAAVAHVIKTATERVVRQEPLPDGKKSPSLGRKGKKRKASLSEGGDEERKGASRDGQRCGTATATPADGKDEGVSESGNPSVRDVGEAAEGATQENPSGGKRSKGANGKKPPVRRVSSRSCSDDERRQRAAVIAANSVPDQVKSVTPSDACASRLQQHQRDGIGNREQISDTRDPGAMGSTLVAPSAAAAASTTMADAVQGTIEGPPPSLPPPPSSSGPPRMSSRLFTRMGLGVASKSSPKETATEAALRAVSDALDKTLPTLVGTTRASPLTAKVRLGVPHLLALPADASDEMLAVVNNVDLEALCRSVEERGLTLAAGGLDVVEGGLAVKLGSLDDGYGDDDVDAEREAPPSSSAAYCCCVVASVTLGYATKASSAAIPDSLRLSQQSLATAGGGGQPLLLQHRNHSTPPASLLPAANGEGAVGAREHLLIVRRADALMAENERLRRESEDRAAEIDLLRSRLALRDEALRLLGKESEEAQAAGTGGRGTGLRAAAAAMEGLRGLGSAAASASAVASQPAPVTTALHHHAHAAHGHALSAPLPAAAASQTLTHQRSASLTHVAQAAAGAPGLPGGGDLPLPHIQRVTDLLNHSQLPPPRPFNVGEHLGCHPQQHAQARSSASPATAAASGPTAADSDAASALSTLGGAAALAAAAGHAGLPLPRAAPATPAPLPAATATASQSTATADLTAAATGDLTSEKSSPSSAAVLSASASDLAAGVISGAAAAGGDLLSLQQPGSAQTPGYSYRKLKPGKTGKNNDRQFVKHNYTDYSNEVRPVDEEVLGGYDASPAGIKRGGNKGQAPSFPFKLHYLLDDVARLGQDEIITWLPHGRCFRVLKQKEFVEHVMPRYFQLSKYSSFLRQLNLYGFHRFSAGPDKGAYYHELFLRGMPFLAKRMVRIRVNGNGIRSAGNPDTEPDFYAMPPVPHKSNDPPPLSQPHQQPQQGHLGVVSGHGSGHAQYVHQGYAKSAGAEYGGQFASA